ncbi:MAG: hypothetical protein NWF07_09565 [Candidatus Bathyarchaeota archaeon]|nr:hypothetical protein [Candidatus Bathyarchaeota archaeon]
MGFFETETKREFTGIVEQRINAEGGKMTISKLLGFLKSQGYYLSTSILAIETSGFHVDNVTGYVYTKQGPVQRRLESF